MSKKKFHSNSKGGMLSSDNSAMANMPQNVIMKHYPKVDLTMNESLDDTIYGVDQQMNGDARGGKRKKGTNPSKF